LVNLKKWILLFSFACGEFSGHAAYAADAWSLEGATQRVIEVAPERRQADASVEVRQEQLNQAGRWPNPTIDLRADNRVGHISGEGGTSLSQLVVSQPLPFRRLQRQSAAAESNLAAAQEMRRADLLALEREAARVFLALQYAAARRQLALDRLQVTEAYIGRAGRDNSIKRYQTPLERQRLAMLRNDAQQAVIFAQRDYDNALIEFRGLLSLSGSSQIELPAPMAPEPPPPLAELEKALESHPVMAAARHDTEAAQKGIEVAQSQRYADPALKLFRERDYLNGPYSVTGVGISVEVPLWNQNPSLEGKARAEAIASQARKDVVERDMHTRLAQSYAQSLRLQEQLEQMRTQLVNPAQNVLQLTRRSFAAGEANVFALVDANNAYFDVRARYLDLMQGCAMAQADLRYAAGISVAARQEPKP
jgi:cobalt-zinc-cadmium efflux system outer membrane protein